MYESSNSQCPVVLFNVALWEPLLSVKESSFLSRLALTLSVVAFALIVSVAAFLVVSEETGILISDPTWPNSVPLTAFSLVVPSATTHLSPLTSSLVTFPSGNVISAVVAPWEIVTGIDVS